MGRDLTRGTQSQIAMRELEWSYYDTITLANSTTQHRMFTQGMAGSTKQLWQTNMKVNGMIPTGERMNVTHLKVQYSTHADLAPASLTYLIQMLTKTTLELKIAGADSVLTMSMQEIMGLCLAGSVASVATYDPAFIWNPCFTGVYKLKRPVIFAENQTVEGLVVHHEAPNAALNGDFLRVCLNGILERRSA